MPHKAPGGGFRHAAGDTGLLHLRDQAAVGRGLLALYRVTGWERWLDLARRSADWTLTFRYSYDVTFDEHTILARYDFGTRGADQAPWSNKLLASLPRI